MRSKAHWGYDATVLERSRAALSVTPSMIAAGDVLVAETAVVVGVAAIGSHDEPGAVELALLFVDPPAFGLGVGRALFAACVELAAARGARTLVIAADPNAEAFYRRIGAVLAGEQPSESIAGRMLPLLRYSIALSETMRAPR